MSDHAIEDTPLVARFRQSARAAGWFIIAVACLVHVGWVTNIEILKRIVPPLVAMNPLTAVGFLLAGTSLLLQLDPSMTTTARRRLAQAAAAGMMTVGGLVLLRYAFDWDLGIDQAMFRSRLAGNRMAPNTAMAFVQLGLALLLLDVTVPRGPRPAQVLALLAVGFAWLAVLGYAYSIVDLYGVRTYIPMALHTAVCFLILSLGVLFGRPEVGVMRIVASDTTAGVLARRLLPLTVLISSVLGWLRLFGERTGWYQAEFGVALFVIAHVAIFAAIVWVTAGLLGRVEMKRRDAEAALGEERQLLRTLIDNLPDRIYAKDAAGRYLLDNVAHMRLLGLRSQQEVVGKTAFDLLPRELAERYDADDKAIVASGEPLLNREEQTTSTASGEQRWLLTTKVPLRDAGGAVTGIVGISRDITARRRAEEEIRKANALLEEAARSERDAHNALKQAQSQLVQTEKLAGLGQMVAGVAHEINNPLSFVSNNVAVLQRDLKAVRMLLDLYRRGDAALKEYQPELAGEIAELAEAIDLDTALGDMDDLMLRSREGLRRIQQIVKDLRDFARLDESDLHEVDLNAGIASTVNIIQGRAKKKRVTIETDLAPLPPVNCYPAKVNQVVMNLVANAIDACDEGGKVTIRTRRGGDAGGDGAAGDGDASTVHIEVIDNGKGMDAAVRDRIFDPFFTTKPPGEGTGLGLSISYGIVADHGGRIAVESSPGAGAQFVVTLPLRAAPAARHAPRAVARAQDRT
jgi:two-component system, NtrC family, sensor kinase